MMKMIVSSSETNRGDIVSLRSGSVPNFDPRGPRIVRAVRISALLGWNDMVDEYAPLIAKDTGALRLTFRQVGLEIINTQRGSANIKFDINEIYSRMVKKLPYSEHHLEVGPTGKSFYIKPHTPGTEPIKSSKFIPILVRKTQGEFVNQLRLLGLKVVRRR